MPKSTVHGGTSDASVRVFTTQADALRARGKLGPYKTDEAKVEVFTPPTTTNPADVVDTTGLTGTTGSTDTTVTTTTTTTIDDGYDDLTGAQLRDELARRELPTSGKKDELIRRLRDSDSQE